ncbi:hypothetical protein D0809_26715, partial [Flavobacterium circumlabens]
MEVTTIYFYIPKQVTLLDLAGVLEVFQEAKNLGFPYQLEFISSTSTITSSSGLAVSSVRHFSKANPEENDIVFISGFSSLEINKLQEDETFF